MDYKVLTYFTLRGFVDIVALSDSTYGEWVIYDGKIPKYLISCLKENAESDLKIKRLLESKKENISSILNKINLSNKTKLTLLSKPFLGLLVKKKTKSINLVPLPESWVKNIKE